MLSEPVSVTIDGSAKSLPRVSVSTNRGDNQTSGSRYATADGKYSLETRQFTYRDGVRRAEIFLRKVDLDTSSSTLFDGYVSSGFGMVFEFGPQGLGSSEVANVRTVLSSFVDSALLNRLLGGEV